MSNSNQNTILSQFASVVALLGSALYFTGWIYRWSYFGFFQLEVTTLNFPFESFLFVPLQVFLGSFAANNLGKAILQTLLYELIIVLHVLTALFFLAKHQGLVDARQDAGIHSSLSAVTLVIPENKLGFGQKQNSLDQPTGLQIIGDACGGLCLRQRYEDIVKRPTNDPNNQRVWRIVIDQGGYFYIFRTLPPNAPPQARPVILALQGSLNGDQLWIFSPEPMPRQGS